MLKKSYEEIKQKKNKERKNSLERNIEILKEKIQQEKKRKQYFERQLILEKKNKNFLKSKEKISKEKLLEIEKKQQFVIYNKEEL